MPTREKMTFGQFFDALIRDAKISKTDAGRRLGMSDAAVHRVIQDVSSPTLNRMLTILGDYGYEIAAVRKDSVMPEDSVLLAYAETEAERKKKSESSKGENNEHPGFDSEG